MQIVKFTITGTHPLLMNNPDSMDTGPAVVGASKKTYDDKNECEKRLYLTEDRKFMRIPSSGFKSACVAAAGGRKIGKSSARGIIKATVFPAEDYCLLVNPKTGKQIKAADFVIDKRGVGIRSGMKVNRIPRCRPKIMEWACDLAFEIDDTVSEKNIEEILNLAGKMVGVMDYRPEHSGPFGRFTAKVAA